MSVEKAKAHYMGKDGYKRLNCGQSVISAFKEKFSLSEEMVGNFAKYGGGRAPDGVCGALFAAKTILSASKPEKVLECESHLLTLAGALKCRDIRSSGKLSCLGCVEKVSEILENI